VLDMAENYPAMIQAVWTAGRQRPVDFLVRNPRLVAAVERYCLPRLDGILVVVEESAARLARLGVPRERIAVVSNTPRRARAEQPLERRPRTPGQPLEIVYLGLMEIPRGVGELIAALGRLRQDHHAVHLRLIGEGRDRHLFEAQAARLELRSDVVEFLGYVENRRALELVAQADIGVLPHHADEAWNTTIPNKLFDYMAAGLAVITSDAVPAARIVMETGAGRVFPSGDAHALAEAILALEDSARRRVCGEAARRAVVSRYHWENDAVTLTTALTRLR
jgi:glycosyltransferase involved in cell wall biosynthesis